jgi:hypothetical protein
MALGEFLWRTWNDLWIVFWLGGTLLLWVSAIRHVIKGRWFEAFGPLIGASVLTAAAIAGRAVQYLGR